MKAKSKEPLPVLALRISKADKALLLKVCEARAEDMSGFVRRAIRRELAHLNYYSAAEKKALGVADADAAIFAGNIPRAIGDTNSETVEAKP
jgi:hypothetical protein